MKGDEDSFVIHGAPFPARVGSFVRQNFRDYESESVGLGQSIGYKREDGTTATIYIFDLQMPNVPNNILDPIVRDQFSQAISDVFQFHRGDKVELQYERIKKARNGAPEFLFAAFKIVSELTSKMSYIFLTARNGKFVKVRVSNTANLSDDNLTQHFFETMDFVEKIGYLISYHAKSIH